MILPAETAARNATNRSEPENRLAARVLRLHSEPSTADDAFSEDRLRDLQDHLEKLINPPSARPAIIRQRAAVPRSKASQTNSGRRRVQIRLTPKLVRILQKFASSGLSAGQLIEKTMWRDEQIRDAALILGIAPPQISSRHKSR